MRAVRTGALIGVATLGVVAGTIIIVNCASATTITLDVRTTSEACPNIRQTGISVTTTAKVSDPSEAPLQDTQEGCTAQAKYGEIGTLVVTPNGDKAGTIGVRVVAGLNGKSAGECDKETVGDNCIIALRRVTFVEGVNVPYVINLDPICAAQTCPTDYTCTADKDGKPQCTGVTQASKPDEPDEIPDSAPPPKEAAPDPEDAGYKLDAGEKPDGAPCNDCVNILGSREGRSCTPDGKTCTIDCSVANSNCAGNNVVINPGLDYVLNCNRANGCASTACLGTKKKCTFQCGGQSGANHCNDAICDAGTCAFECKDITSSCLGVTLSGGSNTISCKQVSGQPSCNDVSCVPGQGNGSTCTRDCEAPDAGGCGLKAECDAGSCGNFEINDGGPPVP